MHKHSFGCWAATINNLRKPESSRAQRSMLLSCFLILDWLQFADPPGMNPSVLALLEASSGEMMQQTCKRSFRVVPVTKACKAYGLV